MALDEKQIKSIVEAALYAAEGTLNVERLLGLFIEDGNRPTREQIHEALEQLREDYRGRGVQLKEVSTGFRFQADQDLAPWISRLWEEKPPRYSRALLETLALIAYRQPITRAEIEEIRGVSVSSTIVKTLMERDWIKVVGHKEVPGKPALYSTTRAFLDYFNLKSLNELPTLAELKELDQQVNGELDLEGEGGAGEGEGNEAAGAEGTADAEQARGDSDAEHDEGGQESEAAADEDSTGDEDESGETVAAGDHEAEAVVADDAQNDDETVDATDPEQAQAAAGESEAEDEMVSEADASEAEQAMAGEVDADVEEEQAMAGDTDADVEAEQAMADDTDVDDEQTLASDPRDLAMALDDGEEMGPGNGKLSDSGFETSNTSA